MTTEYWRLVWQLCEKARLLPEAERAGFVHAQAPDHDTAREVLSLLEQPEGSVLPSWGSSSEGASVVARATGELAGTRVGRYAVGELLGWGASGEVYNAFDAELERLVAIKFLRCSDADAGWRAEGFLREARAASALNHPGIVTIHEVMQSEAGLAIVMELVEGQPFRKLCAKPNAVGDVARWGAQVAGALAAAHGARIIHRDIKPENLVLRPDGLTKVLDFGLAQRGAVSEVAKAQLVGTLRYMSPEQAGQKEVTTASDVFSLGLVLYELLAGRHVYPVGDFDTTLERVRTGEVAPLGQSRRDLPKALERLVAEMLQREPGKRPSAGEVAKRLEAIGAPQEQRRGWWWVAAGLAMTVVVGALWFAAKRNDGMMAPIGPLTPVPLTATLGFDSWPDISPDGSLIAYGWGKSPDSYTHLFLKDLNRDEPILLLESPAGTRIGHPRWSPDGKRIYFKQTSRIRGEAIASIARDGSGARQEVTLATAELSSGIDVSPDGKQLLFADRDHDRVWRFKVFLLDLPTGAKRKLTSPEGGWGDWDPRFSPDGKEIAFKRVESPGDDQIYLMPVSGGAPRLLELPRQNLYSYSWTPERNLLLSCQLGSVIQGLWLVSPQGKAKPSPVFESGFDAIMPAMRGDRIVWVNRVSDYNIYAAPLAGGAAVKKVASPMKDTMPSPSSDGRFAFVSQRSGSPEIWISGIESGNPVRVTNLKGDLTRPYWSPDGSKLLFATQRFGEWKVYLVKCPTGGLRCEAPQTITLGTNPTWAADGEGIYFRDPVKDEISLISKVGGKAAPVAIGVEVLSSRDGKWLYISRSTPVGRFFRIPLGTNGLPSGVEETLLERRPNSVSLLHWTLAGDEIVFAESNMESKFSGLRALQVTTRKLRTILEAPVADYPAVSPDGKTVWFAQPDSAGATLVGAERRR